MKNSIVSKVSKNNPSVNNIHYYLMLLFMYQINIVLRSVVSEKSSSLFIKSRVLILTYYSRYSFEHILVLSDLYDSSKRLKFLDSALCGIYQNSAYTSAQIIPASISLLHISHEKFLNSNGAIDYFNKTSENW